MIDKKDINEFFISIFTGKSVLRVKVQVHYWVLVHCGVCSELDLFAISVLIKSHILEHLLL